MWRIYSIDNVLFLAHRISGVGLVAYLLAHIWVVSTAMLAGPDAFDRAMAFLAQPQLVVLDLLVIAAVAYHGLNGLRVIAHERGLGLGRPRLWVGVTAAAWIGLCAAAAAFALAR
jgi:succinate dehydrogenase / fumarate reductase, cytochrome b subunit